MDMYKVGREEGGFEDGIRTAVQATIARPEFIFRFERVPDGVARRRELPRPRSGTGLAPVVLPVGQPARTTPCSTPPPRAS